MLISPLETHSDDEASLGDLSPMLFDDLPRHRRHVVASQFVRMALLNRNNREILDVLENLDLGEWWLTSGCLFQTVWNVLEGKAPTSGIRDYDIFYYDPDVSWEAEDAVIKLVSHALSHLDINVEVRNQARVHLWYRDKFGIPYTPLRKAKHAVLRFPCRASAIALTKADGTLSFYAPFGFKELLAMRISANRRLPIPDVYNTKATRWKTVWPSLDVLPWGEKRENEDLPGGNTHNEQDQLQLFI